MKKFFKTAGLPIAVFALAISAAFATNAINNNERLTDPIYPKPYYYHDLLSQECVMINDNNLNCTEVNSGLGLCSWGVNDVFGLEEGGTACTIQLYKPRD
ncbi:DUF6520 family protein [Myroides pelagicus]|uniref:Secreted protein n=1 Tax=Myroides pelagicus TaxID=270914 RepID=A0A7K1GN97_9FLAO|nr:DUF6520 family protein [Myroides pelagicus]MTH30345.1 hypothetical protein [Myroides pelagicus]